MADVGGRSESAASGRPANIHYVNFLRNSTGTMDRDFLYGEQ